MLRRACAGRRRTTGGATRRGSILMFGGLEMRRRAAAEPSMFPYGMMMCRGRYAAVTTFRHYLSAATLGIVFCDALVTWRRRGIVPSGVDGGDTNY
jgi:hypothetical protein